MIGNQSSTQTGGRRREARKHDKTVQHTTPISGLQTEYTQWGIHPTDYRLHDVCLPRYGGSVVRLGCCETLVFFTRCHPLVGIYFCVINEELHELLTYTPLYTPMYIWSRGSLAGRIRLSRRNAPNLRRAPHDNATSRKLHRTPALRVLLPCMRVCVCVQRMRRSCSYLCVRV